MERACTKIPHIIFMSIYIYLALPIILFLLGWLRLPIGIPAATLVTAGIFLCYRAHDFKAIGHVTLDKFDCLKCLIAMGVIIFWVFFSGVGNYVWQNSDHYVRNEIFNVMVDNSWPVYSNTAERVPLVYYIGYWLPAALVGKFFGIQAGYFAQAAWAVIGIFLCYALICMKRKKVSIWPLLIFMFFSGLDVIGTALVQEEKVRILGTMHLEAWSIQYQFSSMTTQLFWVFNQAVPAWLACLLVFLYEKPKNMIFTLSTLLLASSFPFVGLIPFVIYFMVKRGVWHGNYRHANHLIVDAWRNWASVQNIPAALVIGFFCGVYLIGNNALSSTVSMFYTEDGTFRTGVFVLAAAGIAVFIMAAAELLAKGYKKITFTVGGLFLAAVFLRTLFSYEMPEWWSLPFSWIHLTAFYFLEAGIFLLVLYQVAEEKALFWLNAISLYLIAPIRVGYSCDFCMRASIPGLLLIIVWCINAFDGFKTADSRKSKAAAGLLALLLAVGAVTPLHEFKRTYVNTLNYHESYTISEDELFQGLNVRGHPKSFFWRYLSK